MNIHCEFFHFKDIHQIIELFTQLVSKKQRRLNLSFSET